jgi:hemoglobin-like flavoprotein
MALINTTLILATLEQVAERHGDPAAKVYDRLFQLHPEFERLFALDRDGGVRASMMETCIECVIGIAEQTETARYVIEAARLHHAGYGVPDDRLDAMFVAMRDVFRNVLGSGWTTEMDAAWTALLATIARGA